MEKKQLYEQTCDYVRESIESGDYGYDEYTPRIICRSWNDELILHLLHFPITTEEDKDIIARQIFDFLMNGMREVCFVIESYMVSADRHGATEMTRHVDEGHSISSFPGRDEAVMVMYYRLPRCERVFAARRPSPATLEAFVDVASIAPNGQVTGRFHLLGDNADSQLDGLITQEIHRYLKEKGWSDLCEYAPDITDYSLTFSLTDRLRSLMDDDRVRQTLDLAEKTTELAVKTTIEICKAINEKKGSS